MASYVIAGAPCSGKTTVINELAKRGYCTVPEAARIVIAQEQMKPEGDVPWLKPLPFRKKVISLQLKLEEDILGNPRFLDTGLVDYAVFANWYLGEQGKQFAYCLQRNRYEKVFLLDRLPFFTQDAERKHTEDEAVLLHCLVENAYRNLDYPIVRVPFLSLEKRATFVLNNI